MLLRRACWLLAVFAFAGVAEAQAQAPAADDVFTVRDIAVDVTADSAAAARARAIAEAERIALATLLRRLTRRDDWPRLPQTDARRTSFLVRALEIGEEKNSPVRYLGRLTVRFKPAEIRALLRDAAVPFAETASKPLLVLPVLRRAGALLLWDEPNEWRHAWADLPARRGLVQLLAPIGDLADIADISAEQAAAGDGERLGAITERYGAGAALVAMATLGFGADGLPRVDVAASRIGGGDRPPLILDFTATNFADTVELMVRAATGTADAVEDRWIEANQLRFDARQRLVLAVELTGLEDWLVTRARLAQVAVITAARLVSLRRTGAEVEIDFIGGVEQLAAALAQRDLALGGAPATDGQFVPGALAPPVRALRRVDR